MKTKLMCLPQMYCPKYDINCEEATIRYEKHRLKWVIVGICESCPREKEKEEE